MMRIPSKDELLLEWTLRDPIVHACWRQQTLQGLTDEQMLCAMVALMAERHAILEERYIEALGLLPLPKRRG